MKPTIYNYRVVCWNALKQQVESFSLHWTNARGAHDIAQILAKQKGLSLFTVMPPQL